MKIEKDCNVQNALITGTMLGIEDHGILTFMLYVDKEDGFSQGFGGYQLDNPHRINGEYVGRVGTVFGSEVVLRILETLEVEKWEQIKGKYCRIYLSDSTLKGSIKGIGHIIKDKWFYVDDLIDEIKKRGNYYV